VLFYPLSWLLHVAVFGAWLGGEVALWRATGTLGDPPRGADPGRLAQLDVVLALAAVPLMALAFMPAVGYQVGVATGDIATSPTFVAITWAVFGGWALAAGYAMLRLRRGRGTGWLERIVLALAILNVPAFSYDCWDAIYAESHIKSDWVALKLQVYALLIALGFWRFRTLAQLRAATLAGDAVAPAASRVRWLSLASAVLLLGAVAIAAFRPEVN
jgi:hypothetical protein